MAHTSIENLKDIEPLLNQIRALEGIREPKPAIFYVKSKPFLHFHDADGKRWADAKNGDSWGKPIPLAFSATSADMKKFFAAVVERHQAMIQLKKRSTDAKGRGSDAK
jgi:hypothetical protein